MKLVNFSMWYYLNYAEMGQSNPIQWMNLKLVGPDTYEPVSKWWRCKDFMNEVVVAFHLERNFSIYGFQVTHSEFFSKGAISLPIFLKGLSESFLVNMEVVNEHLLHEGYLEVPLEPQENGNVLVLLPLEYLCNTLFMSHVTLYIRLANTKEKHGTIKEMADNLKQNQDKPNYAACLKKPLSTFPPELGEYLWYYDKEHNCPRDIAASQNIQTSLMHNCGVVGWGWV